MLVVDDSPEKHTRNYGNLVQFAPFMAGLNDEELAHLAVYLKQLATTTLPDVRRIKKREWAASLCWCIALAERSGDLLSPSLLRITEVAVGPVRNAAIVLRCQIFRAARDIYDPHEAKTAESPI